MVILLIAVMLLVFMTGCNAKAQTARVDESPATLLIPVVEDTVQLRLPFSENAELNFRKTNSTYSIDGFGEAFFVYRFGTPNEHIVVYRINSSVYILGNVNAESRECYAMLRFPYGEFIGLSSQYMLFNSNQGAIAVKINQSQYDLDKRIEGNYLYDNLSDDEKLSFVCPISCDKITQ